VTILRFGWLLQLMPKANTSPAGEEEHGKRDSGQGKNGSPRKKLIGPVILLFQQMQIPTFVLKEQGPKHKNARNSNNEAVDQDLAEPAAPSALQPFCKPDGDEEKRWEHAARPANATDTLSDN